MSKRKGSGILASDPLSVVLLFPGPLEHFFPFRLGWDIGIV